MSRARFLPMGLACLLAVSATAVAVAPAPAFAASASRGAAVKLSMDPTRVSGRIGDSFDFRSRITNLGSTPLSGLVAHLNVVSLSKGVYVDPEDWSSQRTQYLAPLPPDGSANLSWTVEAVNGGEFAIYVVVLPGRNAAVSRGLAVSPAVDARISEHRALDAGGALPLALGVPALLGLLMLGVHARRRR